MTDPTDSFPDTPPAPSHARRLRLGLAGAGLFVLGGIGGAFAGHAFQPPIEMAPLRPVAIRSLPTASGIVTVRGRVAETYGNKFVIDDGSGRTLVDTGRGGERDADLVSNGAAVTVQGRYEDGFLRASFLVDPAGKVTALGPIGGPGHHRHGPPMPPEHDGPPAPPAGGMPPRNDRGPQ